MNKILVLGATGLLGEPAARRLRADGYDVRLLARDPDRATARLGDSYEIVPGDVTDDDALGRAMQGCDGVHISVGGPADQISAENVAALAPHLDIERITYLSGATVSDETSWFPMVAQKVGAEKAIVGCGVPYTILCPTWPMEQLPRFIREGRAMMIGEQATPLHWFAAADLAAMISNAFQRDDAANKRLYVHGPEAITMPEALERYRRAIHPEIDPVAIMPIEAARGAAAATGNQILGFMAEMMAYFDKAGEGGDPAEANALLGAPQTTLDEWIAMQQITEEGSS
jgi:uncharacterized protein YbjT (DUF2867 family)